MIANPHSEQSQKEDAPEWAQVEAIRALAYEQRTANLIALFQQDNLADVNYAYVLNQITERLGLPR